MSGSTLGLTRPRRPQWITAGGWSLRVGLVGFALIVLLALLAPWISPYDPTALGLAEGLQPPNTAHWFGTDQLGRDYFARVVYGGRISLVVGFLAMVAATAIGALVGVVAGFAHPRVDGLLMRLVDFLSSIPWMILIIVVSVFLKPGLVTLIIVIGGFSWMATARLVRAETLSLKARDFVRDDVRSDGRGVRIHAAARAPREHVSRDVRLRIRVPFQTNGTCHRLGHEREQQEAKRDETGAKTSSRATPHHADLVGKARAS